MLTIDIASADREATRRLPGDGLGLPGDGPDRYLLGDVALAVHDRSGYGVVIHGGQPVQAGALVVTFRRRAGADVDLLEDILTSDGRPGEGPGSTTGDNRAISRFVARTGGGLHHVAVRVDDIEAGLDGLRKVGVGLLDAHGRPGSRRSRIAFADRRTTGGLVLHLVQR
ncbi:VOC family protein [Pseudonocardia benzenivorans]|uniref:VOC family protein n=1 Tax=Pseudonocardia benzenivorans TaxID=228005 RepID=A0ABW3VKB6_9PSEU